MNNSISSFKKIILQIILIILITSIFITSMNNYFSNNNNSWVVEVNNKIIDKTTLKNNFLTTLSKIKLTDPKKYNEIIEDKKETKKFIKNIIFNLINNILIEDYLNKINIKNKKKNVKNFIMNSTEFQKDNKFNKKKYNQFLNQNSLNENQYLKIIENKLIKNYFLNDIINSEFLLKNEKISNYKDKYKIIFYKTAEIDFKKLIYKQKVSKKEIFNFYKKNKKFFYYPIKFKLQFINVSSFMNDNKKNIEIKNKINSLSINKKNFFNLIEKITNIKRKETQWFSIDSIPQEINNKEIKEFLTNQKYYKIYLNKNYINYNISNEQNNFYIKIIGIQKKKIKSLKEIHNIIEYILKKNKAKKEALNKINTIEKELQKNSFKSFNKEKLKFKNIYNTKKDKNNISQFVKTINKKFNKKNPVYVKMTDYKNTWIIIKIYKKIYTKINKKTKNKLYMKLNLLNKKLLIHLILKSLYSKSKIKYNKKYIFFKK
ncbi:SurA N-terminal domain-containing protein [Buchnera aphidicola]|uniref:SurA N-terminal domain-containing protein n=1 Tax=Buchnera aphidicola TaxID=9 RepID=UPI0031B83F30